MKHLKICLLLILTMGMFATSCKKDNDTDPTATELLTRDGGWRLDAITTNTEEIGDAFVALFIQLFPPEEQTPENEAEIRENFDLDLLEDLEDCERDNVLFFNADGTATETSGELKCFTGETDESDAGSWVLSSDEKTVFITDDGDSFVYEVASISSSKLEFAIRQPLTDVIDEEDFAQVKDFEGYDDFFDLDIVVTLVLKAN